MVMQTGNTIGLIVEREFECFEEFSSAAAVWDADFRQIKAEKFKSAIFQAWVGHVLISSGRLGCYVEQRGTTPAGMRTFAIPASDSPEMLWFGHTVEANSLLSFPVHGEIEVFSRPGFNTLTFSIPEELLMNLFERSGITNYTKILTPVEQVFLPSQEQLDRLRYLLGVWVPKLVKSDEHPCIMAAEIQDQILSTLFHILIHNYPDAKHTRYGKQTILKHVIDYIHDYPHSDAPLLVTNLWAMANVSERTLENLFKQKLDMTPKAYLRGWRLHSAHRELWRSQPGSTRVANVASNWGFRHMGRFAADYHKVFNELPSTTLNR